MTDKDALVKSIQDYAQYLRDGYTCEPPQWVLGPREYDAFKAHMDDGCEDDVHKRFFADSVRADPSD
jgi:hypothetical protein